MIRPIMNLPLQQDREEGSKRAEKRIPADDFWGGGLFAGKWQLSEISSGSKKIKSRDKGSGELCSLVPRGEKKQSDN